MKTRIALFTLLLCSTAFAQTAPKSSAFGLTFGTSYKEVSKTVTLERVATEGKFIQYGTKKVPKGVSGAQLYSLVFYDGRLVKISAVGENYEGDSSGTAGIADYLKFKALLSKKYKLKVSYEYTGRLVFKEPSEFWECIRYKDGACGAYMAFFTGDGANVMLRLRAVKHTGFYEIMYESDLFEKAKEANDKAAESKDNDAL